ncbi:unnamed protein product [Amoebophrya sp. A120]|nr:unnamed protein product [Amoebophrya sp. A120]|eukprot:GSA120T00012818001.1
MHAVHSESISRKNVTQDRNDCLNLELQHDVDLNEVQSARDSKVSASAQSRSDFVAREILWYSNFSTNSNLRYHRSFQDAVASSHLRASDALFLSTGTRYFPLLH